MTDAAAAAVIAIGRISVRGVDARQATAVAPAIEAAIADAVQAGRIAPGYRPSLSLDLRQGASARPIAEAIARALAQRR